MLAHIRRDPLARSAAVGCFALLVVAGQVVSEEPSLELAKATIKRVPMPSKAELAQAEDEVSTVFKSEIAAATKPASRRELAFTLLKNAGTEDNAATRYALLAKARRLAADADDQPLFWVISELLAAGFEGDMLAVRSKSLEQMAKAIKGAQMQAGVATMALDMCEQAVAEHNWSVAAKLTALAKNAAGKSGDADLRKSTAARAVEIGKLEQHWKAAQAAADKLKTDPADPEANLQYGRYLCALSGDWPAGLPLLAKSADEHLAAAARLDLEKPTQAADQIKAGDAWWAVGESESGAAKTPWRKRAAFWYQQSAPQAGGLVKLRIEKRLAELGDTADAAATPHDPTAPAAKQIEFVLAKGVKLRMQLVPAGKYWIGASTAPNDSNRQSDAEGHEVELAKPFYISATEVTQPQWEAVMHTNPSLNVGDDMPVHSISGLDCRDFFKAANELRGLRKFKLRFPTSVEWEAACRGGAEPTIWCFGNDVARLREYAWYQDNASQPARVHPVAKLKPNRLGIYDMHGNAAEFVDEYLDPASPDVRIQRGGWYFSEAKNCRCAGIAAVTERRAGSTTGLRVACDAVPGAPSATKKP